MVVVVGVVGGSGGGQGGTLENGPEEVGARRVGGPKGGAFFSLSRLPFSLFFSLSGWGVFSWNFGGV